MKKVDQTLDAFAAWLRQGAKPEIDVAIARGIVMLSGNNAIAQVHIDHSVELAREAGFGSDVLEAIAQQGALLLEFQDDVAALAAPSAPPARPTSTVYIGGAGHREVVAGHREPAGDVPAPVASRATPARKPDAAPKRPTVVLVAAAIAALALVGGGAFWYLSDSDETAAVATRPKPPRTKAPAPKRPVVVRGGQLLFTLEHLGLEARLPLGWHHAEDLDGVHAGPLGAALRTSLFFQGDSSYDPHHALLLGTTELPPALNDKLPLADDLLLSIAQFVEYQIASKVQAEGIYRARTCELTTDILGRRSAVCDGDAMGLHDTSAVHTYVRLERNRAIVALFVADPSVADPRGVADRILSSLR